MCPVRSSSCLQTLDRKGREFPVSSGCRRCGGHLAKKVPQETKQGFSGACPSGEQLTAAIINSMRNEENPAVTRPKNAVSFLVGMSAEVMASKIVHLTKGVLKSNEGIFFARSNGVEKLWQPTAKISPGATGTNPNEDLFLQFEQRADHGGQFQPFRTVNGSLTMPGH